MTMNMYNLIESLKKLGEAIKDEITGETVAQEINNEIAKHRKLSPNPIREPKIVLEALKVNNLIKAFGLSQERLEELLRLDAMGKIDSIMESDDI